jgi:hypothetical protein
VIVVGGEPRLDESAPGPSVMPADVHRTRSDWLNRHLVAAHRVRIADRYDVAEHRNNEGTDPARAEIASDADEPLMHRILADDIAIYEAAVARFEALCAGYGI